MSVMHFVRRGRELGLMGLIQRIWTKSVGWLNLSIQSFWWGFLARQKMSDASLLARINGNFQTVDNLLVHLASRTASSFTLPHESAEETDGLLRQHYPQYMLDVLAAADAACKNQMSLLGHVFNYPKGVDWQADPVTGWRWPLLYRTRMSAYVGASRPVDLILFWELNRHQHFISLGIAYWLTGKSCYVDAFIDQFQSWIKANPLRHGINWYYPLEVSIRLISWTIAFQFFRGSPKFQQEAGSAFLKSVWQQADFLSKHLQPVRVKDDVPNNHMMAELSGLILVGTVFPEFNAAAEWCETGLRLLVEQAQAQVYPDGVHKEQAAGYHRFVAELLLLVFAINCRGGVRRVSALEKTLEQMIDYMLFSLTPVGTNPMWGDSDFGRALGLGQNKDFWDFRPLLSAGAVLFGRADWKFAADGFDEESFWLLGSDGLRRWAELDVQAPLQTSRAFPQAGHYVIRDSWAKDSDVAFFRCGAFGLGGEGHCAHAHSDLLSFELWVRGQPLLVDSGTFTYHGALRDYFRCSSAHNTLTVDGRDRAVPQPNFNWRQISEARCVDWAEGHVAGALNFSGVEFVRNLSHPRSGIWILSDTFSGNDEHKIEWFFNFAPDLDVELLEAGHTLKIIKEGKPFLLVHAPDSGICMQLVDGWHSRQYAVKQRARKLHAQWQGVLKEQGEVFCWRFELIDTELVSRKDGYVAAV
jgi:hypothetical protein